MRTCFFAHVLLGGILLLVGCDAGYPSAPEMDEPGLQFDVDGNDFDDDDAEGPFVATLDLSAMPTDPGVTEIVDGVLQIRGQVNEGPFIAGDFEGTAVTVLDADINTVTGEGTGHGSVTFYVTSVKGHAVNGGWEAQFEGRVTGAVFSDDFHGEGFGDLEETNIEGTFTDFANGIDNVFTLIGRIVDEDDDDDDDDTERTPVTAVIDLSGGIPNAATCIEVTPDKLSFHGCELGGPVIGDFVGSGVALTSGFQQPVTPNLSGSGKGVGSLSLTVTWRGVSGTFEGDFEGLWTSGVFVGEGRAEGGGGFAGMSLEVTFQELGAAPGNQMFLMDGNILDADDDDDDDDEEDDNDDDDDDNEDRDSRRHHRDR